jgi:hypothetical protein
VTGSFLGQLILLQRHPHLPTEHPMDRAGVISEVPKRALGLAHERRPLRGLHLIRSLLSASTNVPWSSAVIGFLDAGSVELERYGLRHRGRAQ